MDPFFASIEASSFSIWMRESPALYAFPGILAIHTVGLALLAGLSVALDLRVLGVARPIPVTVFTRFVPVMWLGLWMNLFSGIALVIAYPTKALTNPVFYLKLGLIAAGLVMLRAMLRPLRTAQPQDTRAMRVLATASLVAWAATITAGRLLAYTCRRLMVDEMCS